MNQRSPRVLTHVHPGLLRRVKERFPSVEIVHIPEEGPLDEGVEGDVLLTQTWGAPNAADVMERGVRWVHTYGTGVNRYPFETLEGVPLTCSRGSGAVMISEWVMAMLLACEKRLPESWIDEVPEIWNVFDLGGLHGRTLGLVGIGGIGQAIAERALPFGMNVRAMRRSDKPSPVAGVEIVTDLPALVDQADHVVLAAPATSDTRHLFDREIFDKVKPGMHLVNIARGDLVDQDALREALDDGRVGLASLDCVTPEPLPEGHWLFSHPRVRLSPHCSWSGPGALDALIEPFLRNLAHWLAGEPLEYRVDVVAGY